MLPQRAVYALVCESIKYREVIGNVCLRCGLFKQVRTLPLFCAVDAPAPEPSYVLIVC